MYVWYIHGTHTCHVLHFNHNHNGYIGYIKTMDIVGKLDSSILVFEKHLKNTFIVFILVVSKFTDWTLIRFLYGSCLWVW